MQPLRRSSHQSLVSAVALDLPHAWRESRLMERCSCRSSGRLVGGPTGTCGNLRESTCQARRLYARPVSALPSPRLASCTTASLCCCAQRRQHATDRRSACPSLPGVASLASIPAQATRTLKLEIALRFPPQSTRNRTCASGAASVSCSARTMPDASEEFPRTHAALASPSAAAARTPRGTLPACAAGRSLAPAPARTLYPSEEKPT